MHLWGKKTSQTQASSCLEMVSNPAQNFALKQRILWPTPRKLVNRFFVAQPPEGSMGVFWVAEVNTEPPTEASFAPHQAIRPQAHHSRAGTEPHLPSSKGHISQNHINSSGSPTSSFIRYVQKLFEFPQQPASGRPIETFFYQHGNRLQRTPGSSK